MQRLLETAGDQQVPLKTNRDYPRLLETKGDHYIETIRDKYRLPETIRD